MVVDAARKTHPERKEQFDRLVASQLKAARAWTAKQLFDSFWESPNLDAAQEFFNFWYRRVIRSRIPQLKAVAKMLRSILSGCSTTLFIPLPTRLPRASTPKSKPCATPRGFRSFNNYRVRILFSCGKLSLLP